MSIEGHVVRRSSVGHRLLWETLAVLVGAAAAFGAGEKAGRKRPILADRAFVHYLAQNDAVVLKPLPKEEQVEQQAIHFSELPLILTERKTVRMEGEVYRLEEEGLYRFFDLQNRRRAYDKNDKRQVILYHGDVWRFAGHLTRLRAHGFRHGSLPSSRWEEMARLGERVAITCGSVSLFVRGHLAAQGVKSRNVCSNTMEPMLGDNGHVLCEILDPKEKRWILYDSDAGCRFRAKEKYLDLEETCRLYRSGGTAELNFISWASMDCFDYDLHNESRNRAFSLQFEGLFRDEQTLHAWYRRILQVPVISGNYAVCSEEETRQLKAFYGQSQRCTPWQQWRKLNYGYEDNVPVPQPREMVSKPTSGKKGLVALYFRDDSSVFLAPVAAPPDEEEVHDLRTLPLVLTEPTWIRWDGKIFQLEAAGLYRFLSGTSRRKCRQVILYRGDDMWRFAGHLSRLHVYGWWHDKLSDNELADLAGQGERLSLSSYYVARFVRTHLDKHGVKTRSCGTVTTDEWTDYYRSDNLHSMCEVFDPAVKRWILFDAQVGCRFRDEGRLLNLGELCTLYRAGRAADLDFVSWPVVVDGRSRHGNRYTYYTHIMESVFHSRKALHEWYRRMLQIPFHTPNGRDRYFGVHSEQEFERMVLLLQNFCFSVTWPEWRKRYYTE